MINVRRQYCIKSSTTVKERTGPKDGTLELKWKWADCVLRIEDKIWPLEEVKKDSS